MKETPQKQLHTHPTKSTGASIICKSPNKTLKKELQNLSQHVISSFLAQQHTQKPAIIVPEIINIYYSSREKNEVSFLIILNVYYVNLKTF